MKVETLFGTDGIRANINSILLGSESLLKLSQALGNLLLDTLGSSKEIIIGWDTRTSGSSIACILASGLSRLGINCHLVGVIPTGGISFLTQQQNFSLGIMITASHNPACDNGIKFFDKNGYKLSDIIQKQIEHKYFDKNFSINNTNISTGQVFFREDLTIEYVNFLKTLVPQNLEKKIVIDCGNGASIKFIDEIFNNYKNILIINKHPTGENINLNCGSEYPEELIKLVLETKADLGIAFDGDADRILFIDNLGNKIDGDAILALVAIHKHKNNSLKDNTLVATIMSSNALELALRPYNIKLERTNVGDKNISRLLKLKDYSFGGERSGHLIFKDLGVSGDGLIAALEIINIWLKNHKTFSELLAFYKPTPSIQKDIFVIEKIPLENLPHTATAIDTANKKLAKNHGRVLFRYSGTEMKARILVEAVSIEDCEKICNEIAKIFLLEIA